MLSHGRWSVLDIRPGPSLPQEAPYGSNHKHTNIVREKKMQLAHFLFFSFVKFWYICTITNGQPHRIHKTKKPKQRIFCFFLSKNFVYL